MTEMFERTLSASKAEILKAVANNRDEIVEDGEPTTETRVSKAMNQQPDKGVEGDEPTTESVEGDEPTTESVEGMNQQL
uniref:Uncharacterized protein n=1 Tax=Fagus sylvatica TaxID=28930 RepID=A0A2N9GX31_FAGSY